MATETKEPIYITKNGEGDLVLMSIDAFEKREQMLKLREKVLQADERQNICVSHSRYPGGIHKVVFLKFIKRRWKYITFHLPQKSILKS